MTKQFWGTDAVRPVFREEFVLHPRKQLVNVLARKTYFLSERRNTADLSGGHSVSYFYQ